MSSANFLAQFESLPKEIQNQILEYVESIAKSASTKQGKRTRKLKFEWEGGISQVKMTAVELQHKANEWR